MARAQRLPGTEDAFIPDIEKAASDYADLRDIRMNALTKELEAKQLLLDVMHKHGRKAYRYEDVEVTIEEVEKVKVERGKDQEEE